MENSYSESVINKTTELIEDFSADAEMAVDENVAIVSRSTCTSPRLGCVNLCILEPRECSEKKQNIRIGNGVSRVVTNANVLSFFTSSHANYRSICIVDYSLVSHECPSLYCYFFTRSYSKIRSR